MRKSRLLFPLIALVPVSLLWLPPKLARVAPSQGNNKDVVQPNIPDAARNRPNTIGTAPNEISGNEVDARLQPILDSDLSLPERLAAVDALDALDGQSLSATDLIVLSTYWASSLPADSFAATRERALRNSLMNVLRENAAAAPVLVPALEAQAFDARQDSGMRDYAIQHLAAWAPNLDVSLRAGVEASLRRALDEAEFTLAGTALLGLRDLDRRGFLAEKFDAKSQAIRMASNVTMSLSSRTTALALAAELQARDEHLLAQATIWSDDVSKPLGIRLAARAFLKSIPPFSP